MIPEQFKQAFAGKKITVMGLGLLGRGVGDAAFLAECDAEEVLVTDLKSEEELMESVAQLKEYPNVRFALGEHRMEDFEGRDMILKAAGVPLDSPYIAHAREHGVPVVMSAALFARLSGIPIIGVTGTRGKSTVTHMIHHTLTTMTEGGKVILGGNVRGVSNLQLLKEVESDNTIGVFELDSWQLQGFGDLGISPHIAVFTTFMDDHLNYYKGDRDAYFADKANIFKHQIDKDVLVTTPDVFARIQDYAAEHKWVRSGETKLSDASKLPEELSLRVPGEHNRLNAALAVDALRALGLEDEEIYTGLSTFRAAPGRLEYIGSSEEGVSVFNDNNATTPDATLAALRALGETASGRIILIAGGSDKGIDMDGLVREINVTTKQLVLLPGTGTDRLKDGAFVCGVSHVRTLEEAVREAFEKAEPGDIILFSPGFASFGLFANEYDRNDQFMAALENYVER